ncbi:MAG: metalloregulator ArsR/SmtB family transcription factor [Tabrizicola sp.]|uniref:ArsR/SmtB family transcription factor n=1 Tax=Tabrizicola sp. TaxID=2005166 RepID=UPI0027358815|nr:metalloregulator ArsR/SmtB family transcription factor [Tabrizicola sp.]MDP3263462.1 metalloregulator ArsR/SmtB family transcription factor [Tabrizicola sp.]MDP3646819.1 metalloregulator ArsR/SmtB family transcription factor [Paracoccaceae bacterium]MDZ4069156.1 metalloregulator ArsR/SmtB family transcription factor [Tabrizicola sp.]
MTDSFAPDDPEAAGRAVALLKSLSHVGRLRILCSLLDREMTVGELSAALHEPQASVSQHLIRLRAEGVVRSTRHGKHVTNKLGRADIIPVIAALRAAFCAAPCADPAAPENPA